MILLSVSRRPIWINQATQANYNKVPKIPFNFCYCCKSLQAVHNNICRSICLQRAECSHLSTMDHVPVSTAVLHIPFPRPVLYHSSNTTASSFRAPCYVPAPTTSHVLAPQQARHAIHYCIPRFQTEKTCLNLILIRDIHPNLVPVGKSLGGE